MDNPTHQYLRKIQKAIDQIFLAFQFYDNLLDSINTPVMIQDISNAADIDGLSKQWIIENDEQIKISQKKERNYFANSKSRQVLCGSILQIAFTGIELFCNPGCIPANFTNIVPSSKDSKCTFLKFCRGRLIRKVPLGLIIYAGRNQYNHYGDADLNFANKRIFEKLAQNPDTKLSNNILDPAFDLNNNHLDIYASNIMAIIGWETASDYFADMDLLLDAN
jgi:hypothetical protein